MTACASPGGRLEDARGGSAAAVPRPGPDPGLDGGEGNRSAQPSGRALPGSSWPPAQGHAPAVRPDRDLRSRRDYDGDIHTRDLTTDTPYNTYTRAGLPPTPIALPGPRVAAGRVHPDETGELYFVATGNGDGGHHFSATLEEHNHGAYLALDVQNAAQRRGRIHEPGALHHPRGHRGRGQVHRCALRSRLARVAQPARCV